MAIVVRAARSRGRPAAFGSPRGIASFPPPIRENPYQRLLYDALGRCGYRLDPTATFDVGWLWRARGAVSILHFHWPQGYYRHEGRPAALRQQLSWARLALFGARLLVARALGYRVVWTVHQVLPHEIESTRLDLVAARLLARMSSVLLAHDALTSDAAVRVLGRAPKIVPHARYDGVYARQRTRDEVRDELDIARGAFVFLCFGHIRAYKNLEALLHAFHAVAVPDAVLIVAGMPLDREVEESVRSAAALDARVRPILTFVPDELVADLHAAADAAVVARVDGGTSGALVLALSLGLPVVAADVASYNAQLGNGDFGWLYASNSDTSLSSVLADAATAPGEARAKAEAIRNATMAPNFDEVAAATDNILQEVMA